MKRSLKRNKVKADINVISDLNEENPIETTSSEELIDVCVDMIIKLKEMNLI